MSLPLASPTPERLSFETDLGMPHMAPGGLSESWLLKTCGHQHWRALATQLGLAAPDFRAADGSRLYAAFTSLKLRDARLGEAKEHGQLVIDTDIARVSRTQFHSRHSLWADGAAIGVLEMLSVFVRRTVEGMNQSVERAMPVGRPCLVDRSPDGADLSAIAQDFRKQRWIAAEGLRREDGAVLATHEIAPCPHTDFNGADFLYFASFQSFLDRAEWAWFGQPTARSRHRQIFFHDNVEIGEVVRLTLKATKRETGVLIHWIELTESLSGRRLADAVTVREIAHEQRALA